MFIGKVISIVENPFTLDRYKDLKLADFTENITTIDPAELLGGGNAPQQHHVHDRNQEG